MEDAAMALGVHKNTIRSWVKDGLQPIDARRPLLLLGRELSRFLYVRRENRKRRCGPGELYCFRCRAPKYPTAGAVEYIPITTRSGNLKGRCSDCGTSIWRRASILKLKIVAGDLQVSFPQALQRIADEASPSPNSNFDEVA